MVILKCLYLMIDIPKLEKTTEGKYEPYPPCKNPHYETCWDCPKFDMNECKFGYNLSNYVIHCN
jgi:hypothetical protein